MAGLIEAACLFDGSEIREPAYIVVDGDLIVAAGPGVPPRGNYDWRAAFGADVTVMPGLINGHVHLAGNGGDDAFEFLASEAPQVLLMRAVVNMRTALDAGITTIRDCGTRDDVAFPVKASLVRGLLPGPDLLTSGSVITITGGHGHFFGTQVDTTDEIITALRRHKQLGADLIKVMLTGGLITGTRPGRLQFTSDQMSALQGEAIQLGLPVAAHCLNSRGVRLAAEVGVTTIEHGALISDSGNVESAEDIIAEVARKQIPVSMGHMLGYRPLRSGFKSMHPQVVETLQAQRAGSIENYRRYRDAGVKLFIGDDAGWWLTGFADYYLSVWSLVEELGLSHVQALQTATSGTAAAIGQAGTVGSIAAGYRANVIAVRGRPHESIRCLKDIEFVMKGGVAHVGIQRPTSAAR